VLLRGVLSLGFLGGGESDGIDLGGILIELIGLHINIIGEF
jgi:hypothetical protein